MSDQTHATHTSFQLDCAICTAVAAAEISQPDTSCPEWCSHTGYCAGQRAAMYQAEAYAEGAWLRAAESHIDDEHERWLEGAL